MLGELHGGQGDQQGHPNREEGPKLIGSSHQGGGPNQVRVHLGIQDQSTLNWSPMTRPDSVFDDPYMDGKLI
jgi:hypothetical protein